ncbi:hypothetical protein MTR67_029884 [Solanum verrucosum]|uniref:Uncharacterized protein n=1 Tax=Solanum verrucosum TaxID=315347 RepID=A0AAF0RDD8_SOLVR|nr:hypothetical protein MTR67_029884 [Solanum verrucosum]
MKIAKICEELIKPSSPTPHELRDHKISFIDELIPHSSIPLILFFKKSEDIIQSQICNHLKTSLSRTLTQFYPLAGRIKSQYSIDCNDEGAYYQESQVDASLLDIIKNPKSNELVQLTPYNSNGTLSNFQQLLAIQDLKNMGANKVRKDSIFVFLSSIFPSRGTIDNTLNVNNMPIRIVAEKLVVKRVVFTTSNIAKMKAKLINWGYNENATRVEVVMALLWKCFMVAKGCNSVAIIPVNIRQRIVPPFDENSFGNFFLVISCIASVENEWCSLVGKIKSAIGRIDGNYVEKIHGEDGFEFVNSNFKQVGKIIMSQGDDFCVLTISSWCKFPIYEANFGWGESISTIVATLGIKDNIVLLDSKEFPGGIEAWIVMVDQEMTLFEQDKELQDFTSLDAICDLN